VTIMATTRSEIEPASVRRESVHLVLERHREKVMTGADVLEEIRCLL